MTGWFPDEAAIHLTILPMEKVWNTLQEHNLTYSNYMQCNNFVLIIW